jgi:hypothetical protein
LRRASGPRTDVARRGFYLGISALDVIQGGQIAVTGPGAAGITVAGIFAR